MNNYCEWKTYIEALLQFKERDGHILVPQKHVETLSSGKEIKLGIFIFSCRRKHNFPNEAGTLSKERIEELNDLGMVWNMHDYKWNLNLKAVDQYISKGGDITNIPQKHIEIINGNKIDIYNFVTKCVHKSLSYKRLIDLGKRGIYDNAGIIRSLM